jgi:hypothetical protein
MPVKEPYLWEPVIPLPDEHRLFPLRGNPFKWIAIADNSGVSPEQTDDGVLWLDFDWNLIISSPDAVLLIPIKRQSNGERTTTITDASTMMYLSSTFNWPIEDQFDGTIYVVNSKE